MWWQCFCDSDSDLRGTDKRGMQEKETGDDGFILLIKERRWQPLKVTLVVRERYKIDVLFNNRKIYIYINVYIYTYIYILLIYIDFIMKLNCPFLFFLPLPATTQRSTWHPLNHTERPVGGIEPGSNHYTSVLPPSIVHEGGISHFTCFFPHPALALPLYIFIYI